MKGARILGLAALPVAAALLLADAQQSSALSQVQAGLWEISGAPGGAAPVRQCVADIPALAQFEHRGRICSATIVKDAGSSVLIEYRCGAAGFGRSQVDVITPRSLRIDTQGISNQLPFSYVLQARRLGDCPLQGPPQRH